MSEVVLPKKKIVASVKSPRKMVIFSKPKVGKTSALAALDDALILDFENGTDFFDAVKLKVSSLEELKKIGEQIIKEGRPYKYIIVDTVTKLEDMIQPLALKLYQQTPKIHGPIDSNVYEKIFLIYGKSLILPNIFCIFVV